MKMWKLENNLTSKRLLNEFTLSKGTKQDYYKLVKFHYISEKFPSGKYYIFKLTHNDIVYAVVVYSSPTLSIKARSITKYGKLLSKKFKNKSDQYRFLNKNFINISRIIVHPSVRGIGVSSYLIEESRKLLNYRFIECVSTMLYYGNFAPKSYSYYCKVKSISSARSLFYKVGFKNSNTVIRTGSPIKYYGYFLIINKNVPISS